MSGSAGVNDGFNTVLNQDLIDFDANAEHHATSGGRLQVTTGQYENLNQL